MTDAIRAAARLQMSLFLAHFVPIHRTLETGRRLVCTMTRSPPPLIFPIPTPGLIFFYQA